MLTRRRTLTQYHLNEFAHLTMHLDNCRTFGLTDNSTRGRHVDSVASDPKQETKDAELAQKLALSRALNQLNPVSGWGRVKVKADSAHSYTPLLVRKQPQR